MLWTNTPGNGGSFLKRVDSEFSTAKNVTIASGYVSLDIINKYYSEFERIVAEGGRARLLVGMALYEALSPNKLNKLLELNKSIEKAENGSGVFVSFNGRYHGKLYEFESRDSKSLYVGSSNFSRSGLEDNIECTALITDEETKQKADLFINYLFHRNNAALISKADIAVVGTSSYARKISLQNLNDLPKYDPVSIDKSRLPKFSYPLSRIADKEKSSLNVYFGKGRQNNSTGAVRARDWYEIELIADNKIYSNPLYPKGDFVAYTDDGYIIPMKTSASSSHFKNIRSKDNLLLFGQWVKGKLQKNAALTPLTPVTQETLARYGNDTINFYKIKEGQYYMEF